MSPVLPAQDALSAASVLGSQLPPCLLRSAACFKWWWTSNLIQGCSRCLLTICRQLTRSSKIFRQGVGRPSCSHGTLPHPSVSSAPSSHGGASSASRSMYTPRPNASGLQREKQGMLKGEYELCRAVMEHNRLKGQRSEVDGILTGTSSLNPKAPLFPARATHRQLLGITRRSSLSDKRAPEVPRKLRWLGDNLGWEGERGMQCRLFCVMFYDGRVVGV